MIATRFDIKLHDLSTTKIFKYFLKINNGKFWQNSQNCAPLCDSKKFTKIQNCEIQDSEPVSFRVSDLKLWIYEAFMFLLYFGEPENFSCGDLQTASWVCKEDILLDLYINYPNPCRALSWNLFGFILMIWTLEREIIILLRINRSTRLWKIDVQIKKNVLFTNSTCSLQISSGKILWLSKMP
jgi:hypothetical protein